MSPGEALPKPGVGVPALSRVTEYRKPHATLVATDAFGALPLVPDTQRDWSAIQAGGGKTKLVVLAARRTWR